MTTPTEHHLTPYYECVACNTIQSIPGVPCGKCGGVQFRPVVGTVEHGARQDQQATVVGTSGDAARSLFAAHFAERLEPEPLDVLSVAQASKRTGR